MQSDAISRHAPPSLSSTPTAAAARCPPSRQDSPQIPLRFPLRFSDSSRFPKRPRGAGRMRPACLRPCRRPGRSPRCASSCRWGRRRRRPSARRARCRQAPLRFPSDSPQIPIRFPSDSHQNSPIRFRNKIPHMRCRPSSSSSTSRPKATCTLRASRASSCARSPPRGDVSHRHRQKSYQDKDKARARKPNRPRVECGDRCFSLREAGPAGRHNT